MSRPKSEFLSALGVMFQIWKALVDEVLSLGGGDEDLRRIQTDSNLRRKLAELIVGMVGILKHLTTVAVPGVAKFVVVDHFKVGTTDGIVDLKETLSFMESTPSR